MDGSAVTYLVAALIMGLLVGMVPLVSVLRGGFLLREALRDAAEPRRDPPDPDDLHPNELALLAGGPVRVGETVVMDAFLRGRIRGQSAGGFFTLVGRPRPSAHEKDLAQRDMVAAFKNRVGVSAREMVRRVVAGRGVERLRADLPGSGLIVDSPHLRQALRAREEAPRLIRRLRTVALLAVAGGAGVFLFLDSGTTGALAFLTGGLVCAAALAAARVVLTATGGPSLSPNTTAGNAVVELARRRYGALEDDARTRNADTHPTGAMTRARAVQHTAVTGFRALRGALPRHRGDRSLPARRPTEAHRGSAVPAVHTSGTESADGTDGSADPGGTGSDSVCLEELRAFADLCQGSDASGGGWGRSSSDNGWGEGFDSSGDGGGSGSGGGGSGGGDGGGGGGD